MIYNSYFIAIEIVTVAFEVFIVSLYLNSFFQLKRSHWCRQTIAYAIFGVVLAAISVFYPNMIALPRYLNSAVRHTGVESRIVYNLRYLFPIGFFGKISKSRNPDGVLALHHANIPGLGYYEFPMSA